MRFIAGMLITCLMLLAVTACAVVLSTTTATTFGAAFLWALLIGLVIIFGGIVYNSL